MQGGRRKSFDFSHNHRLNRQLAPPYKGTRSRGLWGRRFFQAKNDGEHRRFYSPASFTAVGVQPRLFLKIFTKYEGEENPALAEISRTERSDTFSRFSA